MLISGTSFLGGMGLAYLQKPSKNTIVLVKHSSNDVDQNKNESKVVVADEEESRKLDLEFDDDVLEDDLDDIIDDPEAENL